MTMRCNDNELLKELATKDPSLSPRGFRHDHNHHQSYFRNLPRNLLAITTSSSIALITPSNHAHYSES